MQSDVTHLLLYKVLVTLFFVGVVTYSQKRWSHSLGGIISSLPITIGPISVFLAIEQGLPFAREAAAGTLLGISSLSTYVIIYIAFAKTRTWYTCWLLGMLGWLIVSFFLTRVPASHLFAAAIGFSSALIHTFYIAHLTVSHTANQGEGLKRRDVVARMLTTLVILLTITRFAPTLGPQYSGILTSLPVMWTTFFIFTHVQFGYAALVNFFRGAAMGYFGLVVFFLVVLFTPVQNTFILYTIATFAAIFIGFPASRYKDNILRAIACKKQLREVSTTPQAGEPDRRSFENTVQKSALNDTAPPVAVLPVTGDFIQFPAAATPRTCLRTNQRAS